MHSIDPLPSSDKIPLCPPMLTLITGIRNGGILKALRVVPSPPIARIKSRSCFLTDSAVMDVISSPLSGCIEKTFTLLARSNLLTPLAVLHASSLFFWLLWRHFELFLTWLDWNLYVVVD